MSLAERGTGLRIEAVEAKARNLLVHLGQALQDQKEIYGGEFAVCTPFQAGATKAVSGDGGSGDRGGGPGGCG
jgi:hypothetical protein